MSATATATTAATSISEKDKTSAAIPSTENPKDIRDLKEIAESAAAATKPKAQSSIDNELSILRGMVRGKEEEWGHYRQLFLFSSLVEGRVKASELTALQAYKLFDEKLVVELIRKCKEADSAKGIKSVGQEGKTTIEKLFEAGLFLGLDSEQFKTLCVNYKDRDKIDIKIELGLPYNQFLPAIRMLELGVKFDEIEKLIALGSRLELSGFLQNFGIYESHYKARGVPGARERFISQVLTFGATCKNKRQFVDGIDQFKEFNGLPFNSILASLSSNSQKTVPSATSIIFVGPNPAAAVTKSSSATPVNSDTSAARAASTPAVGSTATTAASSISPSIQVVKK